MAAVRAAATRRDTRLLLRVPPSTVRLVRSDLTANPSARHRCWSVAEQWVLDTPVERVTPFLSRLLTSTRISELVWSSPRLPLSVGRATRSSGLPFPNAWWSRERALTRRADPQGSSDFVVGRSDTGCRRGLRSHCLFQAQCHTWRQLCSFGHIFHSGLGMWPTPLEPLPSRPALGPPPPVSPARNRRRGLLRGFHPSLPVWSENGNHLAGRPLSIVHRSEWAGELKLPHAPSHPGWRFVLLIASYGTGAPHDPSAAAVSCDDVQITLFSVLLQGEVGNHSELETIALNAAQERKAVVGGRAARRPQESGNLWIGGDCFEI
jgi:hypothetical protein